VAVEKKKVRKELLTGASTGGMLKDKLLPPYLAAHSGAKKRACHQALSK
jgi:hypothetical protein